MAATVEFASFQKFVMSNVFFAEPICAFKTERKGILQRLSMWPLQKSEPHRLFRLPSLRRRNSVLVWPIIAECDVLYLSATIENVHTDITTRTISARSHKFGPGSQGFPMFIALLLRLAQLH